MEILLKPRASGQKAVPKCAQCRNHNQISPRKGHKNRCPWSKCKCSKCVVTCEKRQISTRRQRMRQESLDGDETRQQEEVQLLLNLKSTIEKKELNDAGIEGIQKYRFSGNIQNNMYFPASSQPANEAFKFKSPEPEGVCASPPVDILTPSGYNADLSWPAPCPFCPCNHWEMILPPTQQMPMCNSEGYQCMPHQLPDAWTSSCNHPMEQPFHNPDNFMTRFPASFMNQSPDPNFPSLYQYQPLPSVRYPININNLNQQRSNPVFVSNNQTN